MTGSNPRVQLGKLFRRVQGNIATFMSGTVIRSVSRYRLNSLDEMPRQAPTWRHFSPTFAGGSDNEAAGTNRCQARAPPIGVPVMTELAPAELATQLGFWPATAK